MVKTSSVPQPERWARGALGRVEWGAAGRVHCTTTSSTQLLPSTGQQRESGDDPG